MSERLQKAIVAVQQAENRHDQLIEFFNRNLRESRKQLTESREELLNAMTEAFDERMNRGPNEPEH